jgi:hypothetical protein
MEENREAVSILLVSLAIVLGGIRSHSATAKEAVFWRSAAGFSLLCNYHDCLADCLLQIGGLEDWGGGGEVIASLV